MNKQQEKAELEQMKQVSRCRKLRETNPGFVRKFSQLETDIKTRKNDL